MDTTQQPVAEIRYGTLVDGTAVMLWTEDGETWAVRLDELAAWIRQHGERLSDEPTT